MENLDCWLLLGNIAPVRNQFVERHRVNHGARQNMRADFGVPELGIASELRQCLSSQATYDTLFKKYRDRTLRQELEAIDNVCELVQSKPSVLVCMEHEACRCHRSHLADAVSLKTGLAVKHLRQEDAAA